MEKMEEIYSTVKNCKKCRLWKKRNEAVPGEGPGNADLLFIGEAPGREEDNKGKPFVGKAGSFLDELLDSIGIERNQVFITNIVKCRPPGNRDPKEDEIKKCTSYLDRQIQLIKPKIISTLGRFATSYILNKYGLEDKSMNKAHGNIFKVSNLQGTIKIIPQYHPAAASYNPELEDVLFEDFKTLQRELNEGKT
jgi:DNA polymerase